MVPFHISLIWKVSRTPTKVDEQMMTDKVPVKLNIEFLNPTMKENAAHIDFNVEIASGAKLSYIQKLSVTIPANEVKGHQDKINEMIKKWKGRYAHVEKF